MKQHRPRVSADNYNKVMSNLKSKIGENEPFDNALWFFLEEHEDLKESEKINNDTIRTLKKELSNTTDLLVAENERASRALLLAIALGIIAGFALIFIGICL